MKTGFICAAGFNLVATASRGRQEFIAVVLGAVNPVDRAVLAAAVLDAVDAPAASGPTLTSYQPTSTVNAPVGLRSTICPPGNGDDNEDAADLRDQLIAALGPPIVCPSRWRCSPVAPTLAPASELKSRHRCRGRSTHSALPTRRPNSPAFRCHGRDRKPIDSYLGRATRRTQNVRYGLAMLNAVAIPISVIGSDNRFVRCAGDAIHRSNAYSTDR